MKSKTFSLPSHLDQESLIDNWNFIATLANERDNRLKLPMLNTEGTCNGLAYTFISYHQSERGEEFFSNLRKLNNTFTLQDVVNEIVENKLSSKEIINFIYMVKTLQEQQEKERTNNLSTQADNIGSASLNKNIAYVHQAKDFKTALESLQPHEGMKISFERHAIAVYKTIENNWIIYDSNNFLKHESKTLDKAANLIFDSMNGTIKAHSVKEMGVKILNKIASFFNINGSLTLSKPVIAEFNIMEKKSLEPSYKPQIRDVSTTTQILKRLDSVPSLDKDEISNEKRRIIGHLVNTGNLIELDRFLTQSKIDLSKTPITSLVWNRRDPKVIDLLVDHGAQVNLKTSGVSLLIKCIFHSDRDEKSYLTAERLLHHGTDPNQVDCNETPLLRAIVCNNLKAVELLIDYGADPNYTNGTGMTPLQAAVEYGSSMEIKKELLRVKADPNFKSGTRVSALEMAQQKGDQDLINLLSSNKSNVSATESTQEVDNNFQEEAPSNTLKF